MLRKVLALALVVPSIGCGEEAITASTKVLPTFGSELEDPTAWTNDYWKTYDGYGGLLKHAASGIEVFWGWDALVAGLKPEQRTSGWYWSSTIEVGGREIRFGYSDSDRIEILFVASTEIAILSTVPTARVDELLGTLMTEWDALTAIRTTDTFIE